MRQAEDEAPHLFKSNEAPGKPDEGGDISPDLVDPGFAGENERNPDAARAVIPSVDGAEGEVPKQHKADLPAGEVVTEMQESQPVPQPRRASRGTPRKSAKPVPAHVVTEFATGRNEGATTPSMTACDPVSFEELAALDAENRRLKRLLAERLRAENLQLQKKLARFYVR